MMLLNLLLDSWWKCYRHLFCPPVYYLCKAADLSMLKLYCIFFSEPCLSCTKDAFFKQTKKKTHTGNLSITTLTVSVMTVIAAREAIVQFLPLKSNRSCHEHTRWVHLNTALKTTSVTGHFTVNWTSSSQLCDDAVFLFISCFCWWRQTQHLLAVTYDSCSCPPVTHLCL